MARTKRSSTDKVQTLQVGGGHYNDWPAHIPIPKGWEDTCLGIFEGILSTRSADDWNAGDTGLVAEYSAATARLAKYNKQLDDEGPTKIKEGSKGQDVEIKNPILDAISYASSRQLQLARSIGFTGLPSSSASVKNRSAKLGGEFAIKTKKPEGEAPDWAAMSKES
jgi:hypothetical protein